MPILFSLSLSLSLFLSVLRIKLRALCLLGKQSITWVMLHILLFSAYFSGRVLWFCPGDLGWWFSHLCLLGTLDYKCAPADGLVLLTFCPVYTWTMILLFLPLKKLGMQAWITTPGPLSFLIQTKQSFSHLPASKCEHAASWLSLFSFYIYSESTPVCSGAIKVIFNVTTPSFFYTFSRHISIPSCTIAPFSHWAIFNITCF
jgi:hypothetical protein